MRYPDCNTKANTDEHVILLILLFNEGLLLSKSAYLEGNLSLSRLTYDWRESDYIGIFLERILL